MKIVKVNHRTLIAVCLILLIQSCKKDDTLPPSVKTQSATEIEKTTVTLNGVVNAGNELTLVTFDYGVTTSYVYDQNAIIAAYDGSGNRATPAEVSYSAVEPVKMNGDGCGDLRLGGEPLLLLASELGRLAHDLLA